MLGLRLDLPLDEPLPSRGDLFEDPGRTAQPDGEASTTARRQPESVSRAVRYAAAEASRPVNACVVDEDGRCEASSDGRLSGTELSCLNEGNASGAAERSLANGKTE